jgi:hypothetical protein
MEILIFEKCEKELYNLCILGMLLAGIMIRNIDVFASFWQIDSDWDQVGV